MEEHRIQSRSSLKYHPSTLPIFTYFLTPWNRVLLEKLTSSQLVKKFPAFYGTQRFITTFSNAHYLSLSWAAYYPYRDKIGWIPFECQEVTAAFQSSQEVDLNSACRWSTKSRYLWHAKHCKVVNHINRFTEISIAWLGFM